MIKKLFVSKLHIKVAVAVALVCAGLLSLGMSVYGFDLPIDIGAIGRQGEMSGMMTPRIGAHLFTSEAQRVNELLADEVLRRQESALYLFGYVSPNYSPDPHTQIMEAAYSSALFAQAPNFSNVNFPHEAGGMSNWLIALILTVCSGVGFVLALAMRSRKRGRVADVH